MNIVTWNYRVIERDYPDGSKGLGIHEVYYDKEGNPQYCSDKAIAAYGEDKDSLSTDLQHMIDALSKPTLLFSDFIKREEVTDV